MTSIGSVGIRSVAIAGPVQTAATGGGDVVDPGEWVGLRYADVVSTHQTTDLVGTPTDTGGTWTVVHGCSSPGGSWPDAADAIIWTFALVDAEGNAVDVSDGEHELLFRLRGLTSDRAAGGIRVWLGILESDAVPAPSGGNPGRAIGADLGASAPACIAWRNSSTGYKAANPALGAAPTVVAGAWCPSANTTDSTPEMGALRCTVPLVRSGTGQVSVEGADAFAGAPVLFVAVSASATDGTDTTVSFIPEYRVIKLTPEVA